MTRIIRNFLGGLPLVACLIGLCMLFSLLSSPDAQAKTSHRGHTVLAYFDDPAPTVRVPADTVKVYRCGIDDDPFDCDARVHGKHAGIDLKDFLNHGGKLSKSVRWHEYSKAGVQVYVGRTLHYVQARHVQAYGKDGSDGTKGDIRARVWLHGRWHKGLARTKFYLRALNHVAE